MDQFCILCGEYVELPYEGTVPTLRHTSGNLEGYVCEKCFSKKLNEGKPKRDCLYCNNSPDYILQNNKLMHGLSGGEPGLARQRDQRDIICQTHFDYLQEDRSNENLPLEDVIGNEDETSASGDSSEPEKEYHVFISHASENKETVAGPLANELTNMGLDVWYDDFELSVGDNLTDSIDYGLANSDYGVVIISNEFMEKEWPQRELRGLQDRGMGRNKVILPVWFEVTKEEVQNFSPPLANKLAIPAITQNIPEVAEELYEEIVE
jgi:hypothetical protein